MQDFSKLEIETSQVEASESQAHEELMNTGEVEKATMATTIKVKTGQKATATKDLSVVNKELKTDSEKLASTSDALAATIEQCSAQISYEERVKLREAEIQSLKEVAEVLTANN